MPYPPPKPAQSKGNEQVSEDSDYEIIGYEKAEDGNNKTYFIDLDEDSELVDISGDNTMSEPQDIENIEVRNFDEMAEQRRREQLEQQNIDDINNIIASDPANYYDPLNDDGIYGDM